MSWTEFKTQIWPFKDRLFRIAYKVVGDVAEAEDVVQEVLVKIWKQNTQMEVIKNMEAWCLRLTKNHAIDKLRGGYRKRKTDVKHLMHHAVQEHSPAQKAELSDTCGQIKKLMAQLPENHRLVMHLRDIEAYSYQEISEALEMSMAQVKSNLFRARKSIRESLLKTQAYGL